MDNAQANHRAAQANQQARPVNQNRIDAHQRARRINQNLINARAQRVNQNQANVGPQNPPQAHANVGPQNHVQNRVEANHRAQGGNQNLAIDRAQGAQPGPTGNQNPTGNQDQGGFQLHRPGGNGPTGVAAARVTRAGATPRESAGDLAAEQGASDAVETETRPMRRVEVTSNSPWIRLPASATGNVSTVSPDSQVSPTNNTLAFSRMPTDVVALQQMGRESVLLVADLSRAMQAGTQRDRALAYVQKYGPAPPRN